MGQMMAGKSFELLLTAASATGKLQTFAAELIKFNEFAKQAAGESGKVSQTRAHLFDIMFLMLCHITQTYGLEICHSGDPSLENTFFVQWATANLPEDGQYKPLDTGAAVPDEARIDSLLSQIQPGVDFKISLTRWNEVCVNIRYAVQEVLYAWEYNLLTQEQVQAILHNIKNKMCCLSVSMATFLCSYINTVGADRRQKAVYMLEQLLEPHTPMDAGDATGQYQYFNERMALMHVILAKLCQDTLPLESTYRTNPPAAIPRTMPIQKVLVDVWAGVFRTGALSTLDLLRLETLLTTGGCHWFCSSLVKEVLSEDRVEDLYKGACILYSLFSLDLHNLTLCLLHHTIPALIQSSGHKGSLLTGPKGLILAKLAVSCMMLVHVTNNTDKGKVVSKKSRKRTRTEIDLEDSDLEDYMRPSKLRKCDSSTTPLAAHAHDTDTADCDYGALDESEAEGSCLPTDKLSIATASLMRLFDVIVHGENISEKTYFIRVFLQEVFKCGDHLIHYIVQFTPPSMVMQLIKLMPSQIDLDLLLHICDLNTSQGRKIAAKVVCQNEHMMKINKVVCST